MRVSEQWLQEWVKPSATTSEISETLTMAGLEVDSVVSALGDFSNVCVGYVKEVNPHPNADKLRCCVIDVGDDSSLLAIVCGAPNVAPKQKVAVAMVGAVLGGDFNIKQSTLRGEPSHGMLCSCKELGMEDDGSNGIWILPSDAPVGVDLREYLNLNDNVFDIDITPNRGDCLSMRGVAREVAVFFQQELKQYSSSNTEVKSDVLFPIELQTEQCPRYVGRVISNINASAAVPVWLVERLRRAGMRSINVVVDCLNYVMLELGQPMHAFDLSKLSSAITVRSAQAGETIKLLDEQEITLTPDDMVIADNNGALALAGIMGGLESAVTDKTTDIFVESAYFKPIGLTKTARRFGLSTDSSYRYARGVDFKLQQEAIERATSLIIEFAGGLAGQVQEKTIDDALPVDITIELRAARIKRVLGIDISADKIAHSLTSLGMEITATDHGWQVVVPSFRSDLTKEIDLIEEIARVYRFDNIPLCIESVPFSFPEITETLISPLTIKRALVSFGYNEVVTYSFISTERALRFNDPSELMSLANPLSNDVATMRGSLWPGMLEAMLYNQHRQCSRQLLFEVGKCFLQQDGELIQPERLGLLFTGPRYPKGWSNADSVVDCYDVKSHIESLLRQTGRFDDFSWRQGSHVALHPGQSIALYDKEVCVGILGSLHPKIVKDQDVLSDVVLFEVEIASLLSAKVPVVAAVSKFPAIKRDLSLIFDDSVVYNDIRDLIKKNAGDMLSSLTIFDVYKGDGCGVGKKSIALSLTFQLSSRTLVDHEVNQVVDNIVKVLEDTFNATMRV